MQIIIEKQNKNEINKKLRKKHYRAYRGTSRSLNTPIFPQILRAVYRQGG